MATVTLTDERTVIEDDDTYVSSAKTFATYALLPEIDAGSGDTVAVGYVVRLECTGGSPMIVETFDGRLVGIVPGYGQAVVIAEHGEAESEDDFWRFLLLAQAPKATLADADESATIVDATVVEVTDATVSTISENGTVLSTGDAYLDSSLITAIDTEIAANNTLVETMVNAVIVANNAVVESMVNAALILVNTKIEVELDKLAVTLNNVIKTLDDAGLYKVE